MPEWSNGRIPSAPLPSHLIRRTKFACYVYLQHSTKAGKTQVLSPELICLTEVRLLTSTLACLNQEARITHHGHHKTGTSLPIIRKVSMTWYLPVWCVHTPVQVDVSRCSYNRIHQKFLWDIVNIQNFLSNISTCFISYLS